MTVVAASQAPASSLEGATTPSGQPFGEPDRPPRPELQIAGTCFASVAEHGQSPVLDAVEVLHGTRGVLTKGSPGQQAGLYGARERKAGG